MSSTGMWVVGALADRDIHDLRTRHAAVLTEMTAPLAGADAQTAAWWTSHGDRTRFFDQTTDPSWSRPTAAAYRLAELVHDAMPDHDGADALWNDCTHLLDGDSDEAAFIAAARKASPAAALIYGLGPADSGLLPGRFGNFLLANGEVMDILPTMEPALHPTRHRRSQVLERIATWTSNLGDDPDFEAQELVDRPLRCLHSAASNGLGLIALTHWY
jgi:hypothetical protein